MKLGGDAGACAARNTFGKQFAAPATPLPQFVELLEQRPEFGTRQLDEGSRIRVRRIPILLDVCDCSGDCLHVARAGGDLRSSAVYRLLVQGEPAGDPWLLLAGNYTFGPVHRLPVVDGLHQIAQSSHVASGDREGAGRRNLRKEFRARNLVLIEVQRGLHAGPDGDFRDARRKGPAGEVEELVEPEALSLCDCFTSASGPVISDGGSVAFVGARSNQSLGIFLVSDPFSKPLNTTTLVNPGTFTSLGALAINADRTVAFLALLASNQDPYTITHYIKTVSAGSEPEPIADATINDAVLASPSINDQGYTVYLRHETAESGSTTRLMVSSGVGAGDEMGYVTNEADTVCISFISGPSINSPGPGEEYATIALFGRDFHASPLVPRGIYTVFPIPGALPQADLQVDLCAPGGIYDECGDGDIGALGPAVNTQPYINDNGDLAFIASFNDGQDQGIFTGSNPFTDTVIVTGDTLPPDDLPIRQNSLQLFGLNNCRQVLFKARQVLGEDPQLDRRVLVLGSPSQGCVALDLDGDGVVGVTDVLLLLSAWGTSQLGPPDYDGDGVVGIADLLALLGAWS